MSKLKAFSKVEDETPPTVGQEIGEAMSVVVDQIEKSNSAVALVISKAISDALQQVESREIIVNVEDKRISKWVFSIVRDNKGFMKDVVATPVYN